MCPLCGGELKRHGFDRNGRQRVRCKTCGKTGFTDGRIHMNRLEREKETQLKTLIQAGLSTRQVALLLQISKGSVTARRATILLPELHEPTGPEDKEHCHYCGKQVHGKEFQRKTARTKHQFCDSECYQSYYLVTDPERLTRHLERTLNYG